MFSREADVRSSESLALVRCRWAKGAWARLHPRDFRVREESLFVRVQGEPESHVQNKVPHVLLMIHPQLTETKLSLSLSLFFFSVRRSSWKQDTLPVEWRLDRSGSNRVNVDREAHWPQVLTNRCENCLRRWDLLKLSQPIKDAEIYFWKVHF